LSLSTTLYSAFYRNRILIEVVAAAFFVTMTISAVVAYVLLLTSPELVVGIEQLIGSTRSYVAIPPAYTSGLYQFIFLNNIGHFWNSARIWVWIPFAGAFSLGYELLLNAVVIGAVVAFTSITRGVTYTLAGLAPHGLAELPAFILEFAGLARWHITMTRAIHSKLGGRKADRPLLVEGVKDTIVLSFLSVGLFAVAATVESYVTPRLLGL
jgi:uncharacterized membrane protein SpoIIM required for sporulation